VWPLTDRQRATAIVAGAVLLLLLLFGGLYASWRILVNQNDTLNRIEQLQAPPERSAFPFTFTCVVMTPTDILCTTAG
jgi:hypothetical protein